MSQQVNIKIKINDNLKDVAVDAESLGKAIDEVIGKTDNLNTRIVRLGSISQIAEAASAAFGQLNDVFKGLTDAYAAQSVAETRLGQAMSNTMGASAEEVQSIKDLCSAQQKLGVIGDEVQLAAAQELATYLEYSDSLKAIIPVMNDMAAQQYGLGASAESVTQIATMLGKVMNGQTEALSRYGYKFDDAQKQILQFGTEAERAAVLVDVVGESVGGMNAALAQTPAGRMQQISNSFGDWKERIGQSVQSMMPMVSTFNQLAQGITTVTKLSAAFKALASTTAFAKVESMAVSASQKMQALSARILGAANYNAATATAAFKTQVIALQAAMTMGLSLAITGIIELITRLIGKSHEAADAVEEVDEASEAFANTSKDARAEIAGYQVQLEDIIKHHKNDARAVEELNGKYGEAFGYYNDAATWYKVLTANSAAYCRQLGYEAMAKKYSAQISDLMDAQLDNEAKADDLKNRGQAWRRGFFKNHLTDEAKKVQKAQADIEAALSKAQAKYDNAIAKWNAAQEELRSGLEKYEDEARKASVANGFQEMSLAQLTKAIQDQKGVVESLVGVDDKQAQAENRLLKQMEARKKALEKSYGLGSKSAGDKDKYDGSKLIENASSYKELGNNIKYYQNRLEEADIADAESIALYQQKINELQALQREFKLLDQAMSGELVAPDFGEIEKQVDDQSSALFGQVGQDAERALDKVFDEIDQRTSSIGLSGLSFKAEFELTAKVKGVELAHQKIDELQKMLAVAGEGERKGILASIQAWEHYAEALEGPSKKGERFTGMLGDMSTIAQSLSGVVDENTSSWLSWGSSVLSAVAEALPAIARMIGGQIAQAFAGAAAQSQSVPFPYNLVSLAASMTAVGAAVASIPKFAEGGIAFRPTYGLFGEAGPEAIMPLDRFPDLMKGMLGIDEGNGGVEKVEFSIRGDRLVALVDKRIRMIMRNR
jgi:hypothetical protein